MLWTRVVFWLLLAVGFCLGVTSVWWGYSYGFLFLLLPLMFRVLRGPAAREASVGRRCNMCGFETFDESVAFCPHDGTTLERPATVAAVRAP